MGVADSSRHLSTDLDREAHSKYSPLYDSVPPTTQRTRPASCACPCYCKESPLPTSREGSPEIPLVSDRSALGCRRPRINRLTNRVVSLPELAEVEEEDEPAYSFQPRVASMPACIPPMFFDDLDEYDDFDQWGSSQAPSPTRSGQYSTPNQACLSPRTPSPTTLLSRGLGAVNMKEDGPPYESDPQDWVTWASSPPKPIPALHGPLSLPYARCPSGAEGTVIESDDRVSNVIWGLNGPGPQSRLQPDKNLVAERDSGSELESLEAAFEDGLQGDVDSRKDLLVAAAARLSYQLKGLTLDGEGITHGVSSRGYDDPQLSGLGLNLCHPGVRGVVPEQANQSYWPQARPAKPNAKISSRGLPSSRQTKLFPPASSQLPTPPLSTSTNWTPNLPDSLTPGLNSSPGLTLDLATTSQRGSPSPGVLLGQISIPTPPLERGANALEWHSHPNSNFTVQYLEDYSLGSDTTVASMSGPGLDCGQDFKPAGGGNGHNKSTEPAGLNSPTRHRRYTTYNYDSQRRKISEPNSRGGAPNPFPVRSNSIHRRLPVLEEETSFTYPLSTRPGLQDQFIGSGTARQVGAANKADAGGRGDRSAPGLTPAPRRVAGAGQFKPANNNPGFSQKRWKQKKET